MTTTEFTQLLKNPTDLSSMSYEALDQLLLQFPYCNGIRMLLLKKYKTDKHVAFDRHLALASMYAADRGKLYDFLNNSTATKSKIVAIKKTPDEEKKTKITTQLIAPPPVFQCKVSENPPVLAFQKPLTIEELDLGENLSDETTEDEEDRGLSGMPIEEWLQDFEPPRLGAKDKTLPAKKNFKLSRIPIFEKGMFDFLEGAAPKDKKASAKEKTKARKKKPTKKRAKANDLVEEENTEMPKEDIFPEIEKIEVVEDFELEQLEQMYETNSESKDVFDLFLSQTDGFLKSLGEKKEGPKKEVEVTWDDDSTEENEEVVSETLADLLALQGQKDKAIKMYESLSLKYPEKSRLFADKIADLD